MDSSPLDLLPFLILILIIFFFQSESWKNLVTTLVRLTTNCQFIPSSGIYNHRTRIFFLKKKTLVSGLWEDAIIKKSGDFIYFFLVVIGRKRFYKVSRYYYYLFIFVLIKILKIHPYRLTFCLWGVESKLYPQKNSFDAEVLEHINNHNVLTSLSQLITNSWKVYRRCRRVIS